MKRLSARAGLVGLCALVVSFAAHATQRTFVSTGGSDANACSLVAPCRGFPKALSVTDPSGEVVVLDSGGYGAVSINKSVTISSPAGVYAGISVSAGNDGITVVSGAGKVVLRGLTINGQGGNNGIRVQAGEVHVESVVIANMAQAGILIEGGSSVRLSGAVSRSNADGLRVQPTAGSVSVLVRDSEFSNNATAGIGVSPSAAGSSALVTIERSSVTKNGAGLASVPGASATATVILTQSVASENGGAGVSSSGSTSSVYVRESAITRNNVGFQQASSAVLNACGGNLLVANATAQSGAISTASCLDVASASGTVTNVATGAGLTGGPITSSGTIGLANTQQLPTVACTSNQIPKWNGSAWTCAADSNSGGTLTSVATGTGLTGGPITTSGTVSIANGGVTNTQLANASVDVNKLDTTSTDGRYLKQGGNAFGATATLGTTDNSAVEIEANGGRVVHYDQGTFGPNVIGGHPNNFYSDSTGGQTIAGGGLAGNNCLEPSTGQNTRSCGNNTIGVGAFIGGGWANIAYNLGTVGGGKSNYAVPASTVGGGTANTASGQFAVISGGDSNSATGQYATVSGGQGSVAAGWQSTVAGGHANIASGVASFAAGSSATTQTAGATPTIHDGVFIWADYHNLAFNSTAPNEFAARASGGVRFVTAIDGSGNPTRTFAIDGGGNTTVSGNLNVAAGSVNFGQTTREMLSLWYNGAADYGIGVQNGAEYFRTNVGFAWFLGGIHDDNTYNAGTNGDVLMTLDEGGISPVPVWGTVRAMSFVTPSDRNVKTAFEPIDTRRVLDGVVQMPITTWAYNKHPDVRHIGPVAQDFYAAFGVGSDDRTISNIDEGGVALAAIQGLNARVDEQVKIIEAQRAELDELRARIAQAEALQDDIARLARELSDLRADRAKLASRSR